MEKTKVPPSGASNSAANKPSHPGAKPRLRKFAFNPDRRWGFTTPGRVRRRIIRVSSRKGLPLPTEAVDAWNDASGAGVTFGLAETTLNPRDYGSFAVVVGELIPRAAHIQATFPAPYKQLRVSERGLWRRLRCITIQEDRPRCLVVRKINSPTNTFHVLTDKRTADGLCALSAAPGLERCRDYIAFYSEWAGKGDAKFPSLMHKSIKRNLNAFCKRSLQKYMSSMNESPVLSVNPITLVSIESQGHIKIPALQQTVTKPAEKQSQAGERPSTIVKEITTETSSKSLEQQEQSKDTSNSIPIFTPLQVALEPGQQPQSETSGNTPQTEPATTGLQNLARIEQNSKNYQTLQGSPVQNSKGCQTIRESPVHNSKGCQTLQESSSQNSKGCQTIRESPVQNRKGCQTLRESTLQSVPREMSKMDTCLARLFTVDDEYTASDALELLEILSFSICGNIRLREVYWRFGYENTQQFARCASLSTNAVCDSLSVGQFESKKYDELAQRNGLGLAKGCIERTIGSANLAVANLDALLPGHGSTNDVASGLVCALDKLQEQLPAVTDAFPIEMRNNILSLAHCAQSGGAMRIRESINLSASRSGDEFEGKVDKFEGKVDKFEGKVDKFEGKVDKFEGKVDKNGNCDMELDETMEDMLNAAWLW
ncbi:hypothetical protein BB8028_0005g07080 [Beauveria bassiana]|uniref:Uncharacterized protein n=1 Tax=Beauveria bassiana TaxID=176275 RepID=A0A2S7YGR9_BEABA|nr:hypothetical protein BB8028_0005g07080 [Beauveria bassiana]